MKDLNKGRYSDVEKKCELAQRRLAELQILIQCNTPTAPNCKEQLPSTKE